jgi:hypothetical protein
MHAAAAYCFDDHTNGRETWQAFFVVSEIKIARKEWAPNWPNYGIRLMIQTFVGVDDKTEECASIKLPDLEAFDDERASPGSLSTPHGQRSRYRRADQSPESALPTDTAAFDYMARAARFASGVIALNGFLERAHEMSSFSLGLQFGDECFSIGLAGIVECRHGSAADITDGPDDSHPRGSSRLGPERGFGLGSWGFSRIRPITDPHRLGCFRLGPELPPIECASCHEIVGPVLEVQSVL